MSEKKPDSVLLPKSAFEATGGETRAIALSILADVLDRRMPLDQVLEDSVALAACDSRDRAFVRMMVATTLRRLGQIDDVLARLQDHPAPPRPVSLHHILRIGTAQILFLDVPDHAAVDCAVRLAHAQGLSGKKGFVNAVLRNVARTGREIVARQDPARLNTPAWLLSQWIADYGLKTAADIALANLAEAPLDFSVHAAPERAQWAERLGGVVLPTGSVRRQAGGAIADLPGFAEGAWWVQDAAAALAVPLFGDVRGVRVLDLCAAPGGKTAQLAAAGADVLAIDRAASRVARMTENLARLGLRDRVETLVADSSVWTPPAPVGAVLLDAPCSASGTIRRHPDAAHLKNREEQKSLEALQAKFLRHALSMVAEGGTLIYCTCSLQKAEGEDQIDSLIASGAPVTRDPVHAGEVGGMGAVITPAGDVRVLPCHLAAHGGMDGFFIARLRVGKSPE